MNKEVKFYGQIGNGIDSVKFCNDLLELERQKVKNLTIRMHSYGGSVFDGNLIFNTLKNSKMKIKIIIDGVAASMASLLLLAADDVEIAENGYVMVHRPTSTGTGDSDMFLQASKLLTSIEKDFTQAYKAKTGKTNFTQWMDGKDHWLNSDEAILNGFANRKTQAVTKNIESLDKEQIKAFGIEKVYNRYTASLNIKNDFKMKKELIELLHLEGVTESSSDTDILSRVKEKFDTLEQADEKQKTENEKQIEAVVEDAAICGKIPFNLQDTYKEIGKTSGIGALSTILANIKAPQSIISQIKPESSTSPFGKPSSEWTLDDYRKHNPKALESNPKLFDELIKKEYKQ